MVPNQARGKQDEKCTFFGREGERENNKLGWLWGAWSGANDAQGSSLACPKTLAQRVEAMGVCVHEKFPLLKLSMKA